jgi:hypothetical protein
MLPGIQSQFPAVLAMGELDMRKGITQNRSCLSWWQCPECFKCAQAPAGIQDCVVVDLPSHIHFYHKRKKKLAVEQAAQLAAALISSRVRPLLKLKPPGAAAVCAHVVWGNPFKSVLIDFSR